MPNLIDHPVFKRLGQKFHVRENEDGVYVEFPVNGHHLLAVQDQDDSVCCFIIEPGNPEQFLIADGGPPRDLTKLVRRVLHSQLNAMQGHRRTQLQICDEHPDIDPDFLEESGMSLATEEEVTEYEEAYELAKSPAKRVETKQGTVVPIDPPRRILEL